MLIQGEGEQPLFKH